MKALIETVLIGSLSAVAFVLVFFVAQSLVSMAPEQMLSSTVFFNNLDRLF